MLLNGYRSLVALVPHLRFDVEVRHVFRQHHVAESISNKLAGELPRLVVRVRDDFQHLARIAAYDAQYCCGLNALLLIVICSGISPSSE